MYLVYILQSDNLYYVGMTNDFLHRWMQHNNYLSGGAKYTKKKKDWTPICIIDRFNTKSEAMQCEWKLKTKKNKLSKKYKGPIGRIQYLNELLKMEKWTSNSPFIKDQNLKIYIVSKYKCYLENSYELEWF
jgi:predicted GIY-YIG superfamily endonuclease